MGKDKVSMINFPSLAFQSSLGTEAVLFGFFGVLYSVFAALISLASSPVPIVKKLKRVCRIIAGIILFNAIVAVCSLFAMNYLGLGLINMLLGIGLILVILFIAGFSVVWSIWYMR